MTDTNKRSSGFAQARFQNLASTVLSTTTITTTTAFSPPLLQTSLPLPPLPFCHPGGSGGRQRVPRHIHHHLGWSLVTDVIRRTDKRHRRRNQCAKGQVAYVCVQITVYLGHPWSGPGWRTAPIPEDDDSPRFLGAPAPTLVPPDCLRCHCLPFPFPKCEPSRIQGVEDPSRAAYGFGGVDAFERTRSGEGYQTSFLALPFTKARLKPADYSSRLISAPAHRLHLPSPILLHSTRFLVSFSLRSNRRDTFTIPSRSLSFFQVRTRFSNSGNLQGD